MSERPYRESVGSVRELRPSEDLSLLKTYDLRRVFEAETVSSLGLIARSGIEEPDGFRPVFVPLAIEAREPAPALRDGVDPPARTTGPSSSGGSREMREPKAEPPTQSEVPRRDWLLDPEPIVPPGEAQPYGDDPVRMRELLQWFADGRSASASVLVQRAAGDLLDVPDDKGERQARLRTVLAAGRTG